MRQPPTHERRSPSDRPAVDASAPQWRCALRAVVAAATLVAGLAAPSPLAAQQPAPNGPSHAPPPTPVTAPLPSPTASPVPPTRPREEVTRPTSLAEALSTPGDLKLSKSPLSSALFTIGELWGINIVSGDLQGEVNGVFKQAPLREILDSILLSNGYGYRAVGESLVVTKLDQLGQVNPFFESTTIPIRFADVNDIVAGASLLTTPQGKVQAIPSASSLFVLDFPDRVKMIREFAASLEAAAGGRGPAGVAGPVQLDIAYMKAHYIPAKTAGEVLESVLSPEGKVTAMEAEDRLIVVDYADNLEAARRVLERIDRPRPQVQIKALIYDLSLSDIEQLGINWTSLTNGSLDGTTITAGGGLTADGTLAPGTGTLFNSVTAAPFAGTSPGGAFTFYNLGSNLSLAAVALMLQQADDSRLLASPAVTVAENEQAILRSVREIPFQQLTQTDGGGAIGTTAFREAGVTLEVQPKIARDLTVEMAVRPEFSLLTGFTPGDNQPIIDRRTAQTTVRVANGHTLVLGGMRQRSDVGSVAGIPFLKDVRVLGRLFRSHQADIRESELVVFIRPTIVGYDTPPSPRDQRVAETIECQLNEIPPAEGCAPSGCYTDLGNAPCCTDQAAQPRPSSDNRQAAKPPPMPLAQPLALAPSSPVNKQPRAQTVLSPRTRKKVAAAVANAPAASRKPRARRLPPPPAEATRQATRPSYLPVGPRYR